MKFHESGWDRPHARFRGHPFQFPPFWDPKDRASTAESGQNGRKESKDFSDSDGYFKIAN